MGATSATASAGPALGQLREAAEMLTGEPAHDEVWLWELDRYGASSRPGLGHLVRAPWPTPAALGRALTCLMCPS
ncbi:hypothetical protein [Microbispora sp. H10836]|uniref:hypothetical protein n=1 Tax=Microbispora sp. H10836 TaxID=2729106 RepID=UPI0014761D93|nr:hypothetical protein [Microbispora sp. H10836]